MRQKNQITKGAPFPFPVCNLFGQYLCVFFCGGGRGVRLSVLMTGQGTVKGERETCKQCGAAHWYVCVCVCLILGIYGCAHCDNVYSCIYQSIPSMYLCIHLSIYLSLPCVMQLYVQIYSVVYLSIDRSIYTVCVCVSVCAGEQRSLVFNSAQRMYSLQNVFWQYEVALCKT